MGEPSIAGDKNGTPEPQGKALRRNHFLQGAVSTVSTGPYDVPSVSPPKPGCQQVVMTNADHYMIAPP